MNFLRCIGAMLAATVLFVLGFASDAGAGHGSGVAPSPHYWHPFVPGYPHINPYMYPLPHYGILPPPLATFAGQPGYVPYYYGPTGLSPYGYGPNYNDPRRTDGYGTAETTLDYVPRKRPTVNPAIPFAKSPGASEEDLRRARFEISLPKADAIVTYDGAKTTQTGVTRVFVTPPLTEDKLYTATIVAQWTDEAGTKVTQRKTFEFVAGETLRHRFAE